MGGERYFSLHLHGGELSAPSAALIAHGCAGNLELVDLPHVAHLFDRALGDQPEHRHLFVSSYTRHIKIPKIHKTRHSCGFMWRCGDTYKTHKSKRQTVIFLCRHTTHTRNFAKVKGTFYPPPLAKKRALRYFCTRTNNTTRRRGMKKTQNTGSY